MVSSIELITQLTHRIEILEAEVHELKENLEKYEAKPINDLPKYQKNYLNFLKHRND